MEFFIGVVVGFFACMTWLVVVGAIAYHKEINRLKAGAGEVWHPNGKPCTDGHKWCEEHAKQGKFHCTNCPYAMTQGE